jgi:glutaconate CoA-transferase subunit A
VGDSKITTMHEAVAELVRDGDTIAIEGFTHLICFAAGHEIIRQRKRDLTLCRLTPDVIYDQMVAAGVAKKLVFSWLGNPGVGSLHAIRRRVERSDLPKANPRIVPVQSPYGDETVYAIPPLNPDVAIVHAQRADPNGDTQIWGLLGCQKEAAFAADRVIVVCEEIVDEPVIRKDPNRTVIPGLIVDAVVAEPRACHPSYAQGYYDRDNRFYLEWDEIARDPESLDAWLREWVYGLDSHAQYVEKLGLERWERLAPGEAWSEPVNYGSYG